MMCVGWWKADLFKNNISYVPKLNSLDNTLNHHVISDSTTYDDQLHKTYVIFMKNSIHE